MNEPHTPHTHTNGLQLTNTLRRAGFKVFAKKYYDHLLMVINTEKDYIVVDLVSSLKEAIVPPSQIKEFEKVSYKLIKEIRERYKNKTFSGSMTCIIANVSERNAHGTVKRWHDGKTHAVYVIKQYEDAFFVFVEKLMGWIKDRYNRLKEFCRKKGEENNKLLQSLEKLWNTLATFVKKLRSEMDVQPETKAITAAAAGLLKSTGVDPTPKEVMRLANILRIATGKGERLDEFRATEVLRKVCIELPGRIFRPLKSIVSGMVQAIKAKVESIRIVRKKDFCTKGQAVALYTLHWLTRRGVVPKDWDTARGVINALADILKIDVDDKFLDKLEKLIPSPAVLLTSEAAHKAWAMVYCR